MFTVQSLQQCAEFSHMLANSDHSSKFLLGGKVELECSICKLPIMQIFQNQKKPSKTTLNFKIKRRRKTKVSTKLCWQRKTPQIPSQKMSSVNILHRSPHENSINIFRRCLNINKASNDHIKLSSMTTNRQLHGNPREIYTDGCAVLMLMEAMEPRRCHLRIT